MEVDINKLALLARINLTEAEKLKFKEEFGAILGYIGHLEEADTSGIDDPRAGRATIEENVMRVDDSDDFNKTGEQSEVLLKEAPSTSGGFVKVKNVFTK
jgi:aspartyl-tRNA(Asn)/glutamyl-tRNA(Gln) amidotransferase subunit C